MSVYLAPPQWYAWLLERVHYVPTADFRMLAEVDSSGRVRGAVGFDTWKPNSVQMHVAIETPVRCRGLLAAAFGYVFETAGKGVALGVISSANRRSLALATGLGFRELARFKDAQAQGEDHVWLEMRRENCRWLALPAPQRKVA